MAFSRSALPDVDAEVRGREVYLRQPAMGDYGAWAELRALSRQHLTVWEPLWTRDELARSSFRRRLRQYQREMREDQGYAFLMFREADATLLGGLTISNVRRGVAQSASVGYWMGLPHVRRGHMTDAVRAIVPFAFGTLALHRLEAACLPHNLQSARVLEKSGFRREGTARRYLKINDVWQDHDLYALLYDDPKTW
jgi:ribosomal-protein-alanine N-acetyltransferase